MKFSEIVNIDQLRSLCESFTAESNAVTAILDLEGNVLIATGWQDICTRFHRVHPVTAQRCRESDTVLAGQLQQGEAYNVYKCRNGLVDVAVPIVIAGEHIANFFTGQFFFNAPEKEYFMRQAAEFGFDTAAYMEALARVPVFSEAQIRSLMEFFTRLTQMIAEMGLAHGELAIRNRQLEELNGTLEQRVDRAVTELRLKDHLMSLKHRQAAMGEMIDSITHQWKQPLNNLAIILQSISPDLTGAPLSPEEMQSEIGKCLEIIGFMSRTVDDFRSFFREDKLKKTFGVRESVERSIKLLSASLNLKNIAVRFEEGAEIPVRGYPNEFVQVLLNLLGNAGDVLTERRVADPAITLRAVTEGPHVVVSVSDNGGGVPVEIIDSIFEPNMTTKDQEKGSGIGLFMSRTIIEQHMEGSLTVSNRGDGACFRIELPKLPDPGPS